MTPHLPSVLIVDDLESNLVALQGILEDLPCEVEVARSGQEALRLLLKRKFVVMLLDVQMPDMDGYEVASHARSNQATRDVPILFLTARFETKEDILRGYGTGAVDYLFKPISPVVLRSKIRVFLDLNDRQRQAEQALRDLQQAQVQLVQSAKMASLGELVAGVAHEINNPLAFVTSHLRTAKSGFDALSTAVDVRAEELKGTWEKCMLRLDQMQGGLARISELVLQLRTFSRLDEGERKKISFRECLDSILMIVAHRISPTVSVELDLSAVDLLECYPGPLNLACMNLITNAIDAVDGSGTIRIATRNSEGWFLLAVSDDGPGIPPEIQQRIFEPFFTTKPVGRGTGLGLSMSYSIAQKHGGVLDVQSAGRGTTMELRFPLNLEGVRP